MLKKKGLRASYIILKNIGYFSKPSTSISIFEKIVEPILTYNCEISEAYFPKTWTQEKFNANIWETGKEINKVSLSFLRQILGLRKKTTNIAILSETGKYPIAIKVYKAFVKYWLRLYTTKDILLTEARDLNQKLYLYRLPSCVSSFDQTFFLRLRLLLDSSPVQHEADTLIFFAD